LLGIGRNPNSAGAIFVSVLSVVTGPLLYSYGLSWVTCVEQCGLILVSWRLVASHVLESVISGRS